MASRMPDVGDRVGRYLLTDVLGRGGMGTVFEARDDTLERVVALKMVNPAVATDEEYRERFRREAVAMSRLDSPHVVTVHDHGEHDGLLYLVTQLVPGGDLDALVRRHGPLSPGHALELTAQVLDGLADAHRAGIVHRDIKPSNVLLSTDAHRAYLCDFGIASSPDAALTRTGAMIGSVAYMAPERHTGEAAHHAGPAGDIYAVGCVLWVMLTGTPPYAGTDFEIASGHLHGPIPQLPGGDGFTRGVNKLLQRAMAKDPRGRYPSARAMRAEVATLMSSAPDAVALPSATAVRQAVVPPARRRRVPMALMAVTAALGLVLGTVGIVLAAKRPRIVEAITGSAATTSASPSSTPTVSPISPSPRRSASAKRGGLVPPGPDVPFPTSVDSGGTVRGGGTTTQGGRGGTHHSSGSRGSGGSTARKSKEPAASAAPSTTAPPPPPPYTCWNGTGADGPQGCSYPTGAAGMQWMVPNLGIGCKRTDMKSTTKDLEDWICFYDGGNSWITIIHWRSEYAAKQMYGGIGGKSTWTCGSYVCGTQYRHYAQGNYGLVRIYGWANWWSVAVRGRTKAMRDRGRQYVGGLRRPNNIKGSYN